MFPFHERPLCNNPFNHPGNRSVVRKSFKIQRLRMLMETKIQPFWLFYYDSKLTQFKTNKECPKAIDPIIDSAKYENSKYLFKSSIIFAILVMVFIIIGRQLSLSPWPRRCVFANVWFGTIHLTQVIVFTCIFFQIEDTLGTLKEMKVNVILA